MGDAKSVSLSEATPGAKPAKTPPDIRINVSWCKGCGLCVEYCNRGALEMRDGLPVVLQAERCTRCLMCEVICPDFAITVNEARSSAEAAEPVGPRT
jgi:2-oxoglutarate ferredoxin oxidoreductase subunit delta